MSAPVRACALVAHQLSHDFRAGFEEAIGLSPEYVDLRVVGQLPRLEALQALRSFRGARCFLPLEHEEDGPLQPLLETAALVSGASVVEIVSDDLRRVDVPRGRMLLSAGMLAAASVDGRIATRRCWSELDELVGQPRIAARPGSSSRALLLYSEFWLWPGAGARIARLAGVANALAEAGYDVAVAAALGSLPLGPGVELHRLRRPRAFATPYELNAYRLRGSVLRQLAELAARRRFAFLFERRSRGSYAGAVLSRRLEIPLVVEYGGPAEWQARDWGAQLRDEQLAERAEQACLRHAHVVLTTTETLRDEALSRGVAPKRIVFHPVGVDPAVFDPSRFGERDRLRVRAELGVPADSVVAAFSGSFREAHGVERLAEAVRLLATEDADWLSRRRLHFLLVGDGPELADARAQLAGLGFVTFTGLVPLARMPEYLAASDICVAPFLPSLGGLSPTKLFEYMAMAKPIVASDLDQVGKVLRPGLDAASLPAEDPGPDDERLAVLVRPGDADELARGIRFLADRPAWRAALGARARSEALARYTHRHQVDAVLTRLHELELR